MASSWTRGGWWLCALQESLGWGSRWHRFQWDPRDPGALYTERLVGTVRLARAMSSC